jgi:hypothetical protein
MAFLYPDLALTNSPKGVRSLRQTRELAPGAI